MRTSGLPSATSGLRGAAYLCERSPGQIPPSAIYSTKFVCFTWQSGCAQAPLKYCGFQFCTIFAQSSSLPVSALRRSRLEASCKYHLRRRLSRLLAVLLHQYRISRWRLGGNDLSRQRARHPRAGRAAPGVPAHTAGCKQCHTNTARRYQQGQYDRLPRASQG